MGLRPIAAVTRRGNTGGVGGSDDLADPSFLYRDTKTGDELEIPAEYLQVKPFDGANDLFSDPGSYFVKDDRELAKCVQPSLTPAPPAPLTVHPSGELMFQLSYDSTYGSAEFQILALLVKSDFLPAARATCKFDPATSNPAIDVRLAFGQLEKVPYQLLLLVEKHNAIYQSITPS